MGSEGFVPPRPSNTAPQVPITVEAVAEFGFPLNLVLSTYQHLSAGSHSPSSFGTGNDGSEDASGRGLSSPVTAASLLMAVESIVSSNPSVVHDDPNTQHGQASVTTAGRMVGASLAANDLQDDGSADDPEPESSSSPQRPADPNTPANNVSISAAETAVSPSVSIATSGTSSSVNSTVTNGITIATPNTSSTSVAATGLDISTTAATNTAAASETPRPESTSPRENSSQPQHAIPEVQISTGRTTEYSETYQPTETSERATTLAEQKVRERKRQLAKLRALRAENRRLKAKQLCRHCRQKPVDLTLLPCGHFCFCQECGSSFNACPVCFRTILADVKTFVG